MTKQLTPFQLFDHIDGLEQARSFICYILYHAYERDDQEQVEEFAAKLAAIDKEIETLNAQV